MSDMWSVGHGVMTGTRDRTFGIGKQGSGEAQHFVMSLACLGLEMQCLVGKEGHM